jgi:hypothetical protein
MIATWQKPLAAAVEKNFVAQQNDRRSAEAITGAVNQVILTLLAYPDRENMARGFIEDMSRFILRATGYYALQEIS